MNAWYDIEFWYRIEKFYNDRFFRKYDQAEMMCRYFMMKIDGFFMNIIEML